MLVATFCGGGCNHLCDHSVSHFDLRYETLSNNQMRMLKIKLLCAFPKSKPARTVFHMCERDLSPTAFLISDQNTDVKTYIPQIICYNKFFAFCSMFRFLQV